MMMAFVHVSLPFTVSFPFIKEQGNKESKNEETSMDFLYFQSFS